MKLSKLPKRGLIGLLLLLTASLTISLWPNEPPGIDLPETVDFNYHIRPILSQNCFTCHGPDSTSREGGLRLDEFEGATAQLESGAFAIVPGDASKSRLLELVATDNPDLRMPPPKAKKILNQKEVALLTKWIDQGAKWKDHWAFIKPEMPNLPKTVRQAPVPLVIDHFIDAQLSRNSLSKSAAANKNSLIRRVSYLLTGLAPSQKELSDFLTDSSSNSYEKMVDNYLASPHFGERWARHWMDLVRYAEHMGHEFDFPISGAWQYRDYLIRAFNEDVPYDLFVKEHLAGDMLEEPRYHPLDEFNESIIGTGYFFLGEGKHGPVNIKEEEAIKIDNVIDVTSKTFQAMTVACARCHDHKFDPIPTTDYYAMYGMIESARLGPLPARTGKKQEQLFAKLSDTQRRIRAELGHDWGIALEEISEESVIHLAKFFEEKKEAIDPKAEVSKTHSIIGDFRKGSWEGWYSDGFAFGDSPLMGEPVFDSTRSQVVALERGKASSKKYGTGLHGVLRSPNFIIEHDSIAVRAAGKNGEIRLIVDNFQVIQNPIYENLNVFLNHEEMKTYYFDLSMVQGRKAYLQFTPGNYIRNGRHVYSIEPEDYIEVEYALAYTGGMPEMDMPSAPVLAGSNLTEKKEAIASWEQGKLNSKQVAVLDEVFENIEQRPLPPKVRELLDIQDSLSSALYDSTQFIGMTEGDAVFSPVFIRGSSANLSKEKVPRQFLHAVNAGPTEFPQTGSGRLAWAEAVVDPNNPLTGRVIVNRIWHHLFGRGIVETVDNFGLQGKLPTHPQLLDYLALQIQKESWSMKTMIRHILMTEAFQRSTTALPENAEKDPTDLFLHHFPIRRLEGEVIRDGILSVSGCLNPTLFGEPIPVHLTDFMTGRGRPRYSGPLDGEGRRSIYTAVRRNFLAPMMLVFDTPIPFSTFGKRNTTNVPAQSLTLLNDPFVLDQAHNWAENLVRETPGSSEDRIRVIYERAFSRKPLPEEITSALDFLNNQAKGYDCSLDEMKDDPRLWADYCHAVFNLKEFIHLL